MLFDKLSLSNVIDEDAEFIPLMTQEEEKALLNEDTPEILPILPVRNTVLFPGVVIPVTAGRDKSITLIRDAQNGDKTIGVVSQKDTMVEDPKRGDLNKVGTVARIMRMLKMPDGNITIIIQGKRRFLIEEYVEEKPYFKAKVRKLEEIRQQSDNSEFKALVESIREVSLQIIKENPVIPSEAGFAMKNIESDSFLINFISSNMNLPVEDKQFLLGINDLKKRATETLRFLNVELQQLKLRNDIQSKVRTDLDKQQREYFLHQQMKTIQEELGDNSSEQEFEEMQKRAKKKKWNKSVRQHFEKELKKMKRMNPQVAEFSIQRNYLEFILDLPWEEYSKDNFDLNRAERVLNKDHYGLEKVKERIIEHLAVLKLKGDMKSPLICLYGPPGVGKTSLGKSIAEALGRKYQRISLGGVHDEAEIRGHRKTYIGAMPGRVLQSIKKVGKSNPVFVLDEIDKLGKGYQGDPSSAMLEVLDPEQNHTFYDNFLETGYDLSKVMFIATANNIWNIQPPLRDRMEMIEVTGYTTEEKIEIAKRHLLPKQLKEHGLDRKSLAMGKREFEKVIEGYTRESGVRMLDKRIAKLVRYAAKNIAMEQEYTPKLSSETIEEILGPARLERDKYENNDIAGVVTGLAWTAVGGDILFIESVLSKGKGQMSITGNLGKVMKESATIALEYIKTHHEVFGISPEMFTEYNLHVHVPEGATPKDGPSAGITMLTSLVSAFTQRKVKARLAMTGEITLRGKVLPVGGIKEKILAAKRANIKEIILCEENKKDIDEIRQDYLKGLKFLYVTNMTQVIEFALLKSKAKKI